MSGVATMSLQRKLAALRRRGAARAIVRRAREALWSDCTLVVFRITPEQAVSVAPALDDGVSWSYECRTPHELARMEQPLPASLVGELAQGAPDRRIHLLRVAGALASWGVSDTPDGWWPLTETRSILPVEPRGVCLTAFETEPRYRGHRLYPALLSRILRERFSEGARVAFIWCEQDNAASHAGIIRVGFRELARHRARRVLWMRRHQEWRTGD